MLDWFKKSFAQIGKSATFYYLMDKFLRKTKIGSVYPYYFLAQPLKDNGTKVRLSKNYLVRKIEPNDTELLKILPQSICDYRFKQNAVCVGAFKAGRLTALLWFTPRLFHEDEVRADFMPPQKACWDFGVHVEPEFRMTRVFSSLWGASTHIMQGMGFDTSLSRISAFNPNSLKSHTRMGAKLLAKAVFINIGSVQICLSNIKPRIDISFSKKSRVVIYF